MGTDEDVRSAIVSLQDSIKGLIATIKMCAISVVAAIIVAVVIMVLVPRPNKGLGVTTGTAPSQTQTVTNNIQTPDEKEEIRKRAIAEGREGWYTIPEAAKMFGVGERELFNRRKAGEFEEISKEDSPVGRVLVRPASGN